MKVGNPGQQVTATRRERVAGDTGRWHVHARGACVLLERGEVMWGVRGQMRIPGGQSGRTKRE